MHNKTLFFFLSGALFEDGEDSQQAAFMFAVDMTNADRSVLVRTKLVAHPEQIPRGDSFKATKKSKLETIYFTSDIYEHYVPHYLLPFCGLGEKGSWTMWDNKCYKS